MADSNQLQSTAFHLASMLRQIAEITKAHQQFLRTVDLPKSRLEYIQAVTTYSGKIEALKTGIRLAIDALKRMNTPALSQPALEQFIRFTHTWTENDRIEALIKAETLEALPLVPSKTVFQSGSVSQVCELFGNIGPDKLGKLATQAKVRRADRGDKSFQFTADEIQKMANIGAMDKFKKLRIACRDLLNNPI